jgi:hypothetical protein
MGEKKLTIWICHIIGEKNSGTFSNSGKDEEGETDSLPLGGGHLVSQVPPAAIGMDSHLRSKKRANRGEEELGR